MTPITERIHPLIEAAELMADFDNPNRVILDGTFSLPAQNRNPADEYLRGHIQGARFFDIDVIAASESDLPHMLPTSKGFEDAVSELGISNQTEVVVYDNNQFMASARVWWMFKTFGHENIRVLNGGLHRWLQLGFSITDELPNATSIGFSAHFDPERVRDFNAMQRISENGTALILDARPEPRFIGQSPEPRPGLRSGHIPGSRNLFFQHLIDPESHCLKSKENLLSAFERVGATSGIPVVTTCGSGVTAAILTLALAQLGYTDTPIYDGSWAEWGQPGPHEVAVGDASKGHAE